MRMSDDYLKKKKKTQRKAKKICMIGVQLKLNLFM